jgi:hypothetical protein
MPSKTMFYMIIVQKKGKQEDFFTPNLVPEQFEIV